MPFMTDNDEDLSSFLMSYGFTEDELFAITYELNSYRSIPGTTVKRYLNRVLQTIIEEDRAAFLKGIMVGVAINYQLEQSLAHARGVLIGIPSLEG